MVEVERSKKMKFCPLILAGWVSYFGDYDSSGSVGAYCKCSADCAWYSEHNQKCELLVKEEKK